MGGSEEKIRRFAEHRGPSHGAGLSPLYVQAVQAVPAVPAVQAVQTTCFKTKWVYFLPELAVLGKLLRLLRFD